MGRFSLLLPLVALVPSVIASYESPEMKSAASAMIAKYTEFVHYDGPSSSAAAAAAASSVKKSAVTIKVDVPQATASGKCSYWLDEIAHQGVAAFNGNASYQVYRNVMDFGAKGDGVTDDSAAINSAISSGRESASPKIGQSATNTPAVVYFPPGTYLLSSSIIDYYYTQLIGNPNCMPQLLAAPGFSGFGIIDGDQYQSTGFTGFGATNVFYRQVRNFIFNTTLIPATTAALGVHWPTAQATSIQNCIFVMPDVPGVVHQGIFLESGSAGFMTDLIFHGGGIAMNVGNQQYTMRNLTFNNAVTAISIFFDWGWTFTGVTINNCSIGLDISASPSDQSDHSVMMIDSSISNTPTGVNSAYNVTNNNPPSGGTLILENVQLKNVTRAVVGAGATTLLAGTSGSKTIGAYVQGHRYNPSGPMVIDKTIPANPRPAQLVDAKGNYFTMSKPQYGTTPVSEFISVRLTGAKGDGVHDDTLAFQKALNSTANVGQILFVDAGTYLVTKTLYVPPGARIVGESYSVIMSSGSYFNNVKSPKPVVQVGTAGQKGTVEWSDMIVSTHNAKDGQIGAILIEWNLASPAGNPSGFWDVHTRIGGFIGSGFEGGTCPTTPSSPKTSKGMIDTQCYAAYMSMYVTPSASGLYMENNWFWTADHDIDNNEGGNQITVYTGRGLLIESTAGTIWMYGHAVEHHSLYQYQFVGTKNIFMGQIQTETAYWQPNPNASIPFTANPTFDDPVFPSTPFVDNATGLVVPNADGWGFRSVNSSLLIYGAGHYSFFNNYSTTCSNQGNQEQCQSRIFDVEGGSILLYDLHTVGTHEMITLNGVDIAYYADNLDDFTDNIAVFRTMSL